MRTRTDRVSRRSIRRPGTVLPVVLVAAAALAALTAARSATPPTRAASFSDGAPIGALDRLRAVPGGVRAVGWVFDPSDKSAAVRTNVWVDGSYAGGAEANLPRDDVASNYPKAGPDHGFAFFAPVPEGEHTVCVRAKNIADGSNYVLRCATRTFDYGPRGSLDALRTQPGHLFVRGWVIDWDQPTDPVALRIVVDGMATTLSADRYRNDIATTRPNAGGNHGFRATLRLKQGTHTVCVNTANIGHGTDNTFGCQTIVLNDSPRGALESVVQSSGALEVIGWAFDTDAPTTPLTVSITVDGVTHTLLARTARPDIAAKYPHAGRNHGFVATYRLPEGSHRVCVTTRDIGYGSDVTFRCLTGTLNFTPTAMITGLWATRTGLHVRGWATDPDTAAPISVAITVDGRLARTKVARHPGGGHDGHVFTLPMLVKSGAHRVCAIAINALYGTHNSAPSCRPISLALKPLGGFGMLRRATGSADLRVRGWALDPDTTRPVSVQITLDGAVAAIVPADAPRADVAADYPAFGPDHGLWAVVQADDGEHTVCVTALNVGGGANLRLGCKLIIAVHPVAPSAPRSVTALAGYGGAEVTWQRPRSDGGAPWTNYIIVTRPGGIRVSGDADATSATVLGLQPGTSYTFSVQATNVAGASTAGVSPSVTTQARPPAQKTPAPVSTSRYIRNIRSASTQERAMMHSEGAIDASQNPSGHGYIVLLAVGGQDEYDGGVVLSAGVRFVSYTDVVADIKAYVAGYHSKQHASAPVTIAIGTNNDMDVSWSSGKSWATKVVNPVATYVRRHYSGIVIAGADDMEPGFRASYYATKQWLGGYLANTRAPFVFDGSADGCAWTTMNQGCNNGWRMSGLYHLAGGAAPIRMLNLPQIYNSTMAAQWKYISLTGVAAGRPRINFAGTLTEWTACAQTNSCGSMTGRTAWTTLWNNLQSDNRLKVGSLPYATDLRVDA